MLHRSIPTASPRWKATTKIAMAMLEQGHGGYPKNLGEGLSAIGDAIGERSEMTGLLQQQAAAADQYYKDHPPPAASDLMKRSAADDSGRAPQAVEAVDLVRQ